MKTVKIFFGIAIILTFTGISEVKSQWSFNGIHIYNNNMGNVGIGNSSPGKLLYVGKNMTEPTAVIRNFGGTGGATFEMIDDASGADWKFKATLSGGFKIRDNANALDVLTMEPNSIANAIYIQTGGNVGIRTNAPTAHLHVAKTDGDYTTIFGTNLGTGNYTTNDVTIGNDLGNALLYIGQSDLHKAYLYWNYNADPAGAYFTVGCYGGSNDMVLQEYGGRVGIHTYLPSALLDVQMDANNYSRLGYMATQNNYFYQRQVTANGNGQSGLYVFRTRDSQNDGAGYTPTASNNAIVGYNYYGDPWSFGVSGFSWFDNVRCGGILGARYSGDVWGSLGYRSSGGTNYGGYFTSSVNGAGKGAASAHVSIGLGTWGDLMGADIHGQVYGTFTEGENYALYSHGTTYKDELDVHLQLNEKGTNTALYTYVSTDVCVQTSGVATLSEGRAAVSFDPAFASIVSGGEPVIVTVTPVGSCNGVYLSEVSAIGFTVIEANSGKSSVPVNYIAIGKRAGYEKPQLAPEVVDPAYVTKVLQGLHNDNNLDTNGEGLYYENGQLVVGKHPSTISEPNRPADETIIPPNAKASPVKGTGNNDGSDGRSGK